MRKIILYVVGALVVFFGVFSFIIGFFNLSGESVGFDEQIWNAVIVLIGIAIIVVNRFVKAQKSAADAAVNKPFKLGLIGKGFYNRLKDGRCLHCGEKMSVAPDTYSSDEDKYQCPNGCMSYHVRRNGLYTTEADENGKLKLVAHDLYVSIYLYRKYYDGDCACTVGEISKSDCDIMLRVFEFAESQPKAEYGEDTPEFKQAKRDGEVLDQETCPICHSKIEYRKVFVKGYRGGTVTEFEPAWIPSLGGSVFIKHERSNSIPDHYEDVVDCKDRCCGKTANHQRIARAIPFRTKESYNVDNRLGKHFKIKGGKIPWISYPDNR